jgi:hypothetical protein
MYNEAEPSSPWPRNSKRTYAGCSGGKQLSDFVVPAKQSLTPDSLTILRANWDGLKVSSERQSCNQLSPDSGVVPDRRKTTMRVQIAISACSFGVLLLLSQALGEALRGRAVSVSLTGSN